MRKFTLNIFTLSLGLAVMVVFGLVLSLTGIQSSSVQGLM
ncbi:hypothetical protein QU862_29710, partial [Escherichia coli]|nr:hypothetical protein [Escherichia coli]